MIKRYEDEIYGPSSYDFEESESGSWVKYEDHAAEVARLNEQVRALAAENADLRKWAKVVGFDKDTEASANMEYGGLINALNSIKSDSTYAILNEVRAQGADDFAAEMYRVANEHVASGRSKKDVIQCRAAAKAAEDYAAAIRAGEVPNV